MPETKSVCITRLVAVPSLVTLGITFLRLMGELRHWPTPWFNTSAGGGGAVIGISWLPLIFGPYFAVKLVRAGECPESSAKPIGFAVLGLAVYFLSVFLFRVTMAHPSNLTLLAFPMMLVSAFVPGIGWRALGNALVAYAFAARIPVLIVMWLAMYGNGGQGWGTHYDAVPPVLAAVPLPKRFIYAAVVPQMTMWIGWTVVVGALAGVVVAAVALRGKYTAQATA